MNSSARVMGVVLGLGAIAATATFIHVRHRARNPAPPPPPTPAAPRPKPAPAPVTESLRIHRGDTLDEVLGRAGIASPARVEISSAIARVFDVTRFRADSELMLTRGATDVPEALAYHIDADHLLRVSHSVAGFDAAVVEIPGTMRVDTVCGTMQNSLFESLERAGQPPELALDMAAVFVWDLDFYTDPQPGDPFCLVLETKEYANGQPPSYRKILAARYDNAGTVHEGYLSADRNGRRRYYSADGRALEAAFLRSPLKFDARISSHFARRRFHPVLRIYRPHLGTDYAAPVGTPVQAIAAGQVVFVGRAGGAGKMVRIRHTRGYESAYLHLSRVFVRVGQRVGQGQRIAAVGATGLATGPHLDFRLSRSGRLVDFERFTPPRAARLDAQRMREFASDRSRLADLMDAALASVRPVLAGAAETIPTAGGN